MILLYHDSTTHGMIATPEGRVAGEAALPRRYVHEGHFVAVDGAGSEHVAAHDAREILKINGYRLATPSEQDAYHRMHAQAGALHEKQAPHEEVSPMHEAESAPAEPVPSMTLTTETAPRARKKG